MHAHSTPRRRPSESVSSKPARAHARALAIALMGVLVLGSLALVIAGGSLWGPTAAVGSQSTSPSPNAVVRDALTWPFSRDSIWNLPIGAGAVYVPGDLLGTGNSGAHGGSMLSSLGGTIRLGELVPGGAIRHALKVNLYGNDDYYYDGSTHGYRWPATTADGYASGAYHGSVPALRMG